jgi:hypothetical protein
MMSERNRSGGTPEKIQVARPVFRSTRRVNVLEMFSSFR